MTVRDKSGDNLIGHHILLDLAGVDAGLLSDPDVLGRCLVEAAASCDLTPLAPPSLYPFPGGGLTGFLVLAESHISIHTYPDRFFAAVDIFSCGTRSPRHAADVFRQMLRPRSERLTEVERGLPLESPSVR